MEKWRGPSERECWQTIRKGLKSFLVNGANRDMRDVRRRETFRCKRRGFRLEERRKRVWRGLEEKMKKEKMKTESRGKSQNKE